METRFKSGPIQEKYDKGGVIEDIFRKLLRYCVMSVEELKRMSFLFDKTKCTIYDNDNIM